MLSEFRPLLIVALLALGGLVLPFRVLHATGWLLRGCELSTPFHFEPRFAARRDELARSGPVEVVFTGDSRVEMGIAPRWISCVKSFNLACAAMTLPLVSSIALDTLRELGVHPRYVGIGITPELAAVRATDDDETRQVGRLYAAAEARRKSATVWTVLEEQLFGFVLQRDTLMSELAMYVAWLTRPAPPERTLHLAFNRPLSWSEYFHLADRLPIDRGWARDTSAAFTNGEFPAGAGIRRRLEAPYAVDVARLERLVAEIRATGAEPILIEMPLSASFYRSQGEALRPAVHAAVASVAAQADVLALAVPFDAEHPGYYADGHHLSAAGAEAYSRALDGALAGHLASDLPARRARHGMSAR